MRKTILITVAFLVLAFTAFMIGRGSLVAAADQDTGLPMYPGAKQDPANPPINAPHMKNIHIVSYDSFQKVLDWYSQKLGKFTLDPQKGGTQALWSKETRDGMVMTVTISTINAPPGQTKITMTKMQMKR